MKKLITLFVACLSLSALADEVKRYEMYSSSSEATAKVKSIDYKTRKITLADEDEETSFVVSDEVKNFNQIKKGDFVKINYNEGIAWQLNKGGKASGTKESESKWTARPGTTPDAGVSREVTASVVIKKIDKSVPSVTVETADGATKTLKVRHPERLEGVKVGDAIDVIYSEAMAVKVEKATKQ